VNLRPGLRLFAQHGEGRCSSRISSATLVRESLIGRPFFNLSHTNSPVRFRWAGSVCRPGTAREALAISGRRGFSIASIVGRRFPGFPAVLPEDIHIRGNNRSVGINQSM